MSRRKDKATIVGPRRSFLKIAIAGGAGAALAPAYPAFGAARETALPSPKSEIKPFELDEITIPELQDGMKSGKFTAHSLVEKYSARVAEIDKQGPCINSIIEMNPDAFSIADALDEELRTFDKLRDSCRPSAPDKSEVKLPPESGLLS